jgi:hypothetical protein
MTDCTSCVMERWGKLRVLVGNWTLLQASELGVNLALRKAQETFSPGSSVLWPRSSFWRHVSDRHVQGSSP